MSIYALYKGDEVLGVGTLYQLSDKLDIEKSTLMFYGTPSYRERTSEEKGRRLIKLEG